MLLSVLIDALANALIRQICTYFRVDISRNLLRRFIPAQGVQKYKTLNQVTRCPLLTLLHFHKNNCISIIDRSCFVLYLCRLLVISKGWIETQKRENLSIEMTAESPPIVSETLE